MVVGAALVLPVVARIVLPYALEAYINDELAEIGEYRGRIENVDVALVRGAYVVDRLTIVKAGVATEQPFLAIERMDISLQWNALLDAELVGEMVLEKPVLNLIQGETEPETQLGTGVNWPDQVREFFPFRFNAIEVREGTATFRAPGIDADESLNLQRLSVMLRDLTNVEERQDAAYAQLEAIGTVMGSAPISVAGRFDPNESKPVFDVDFSLEDARLVDVNPWLREFLKVDAEQGTFSMYAEIATSQGRFEGYVKPILEDPQIFALDEEASGPFQKAWEALVDVGMKIFKSRERQQVATEIPISGELEDPEPDLLATLVNLLKNAFVSAFSHSLEGTVGLGDVLIGAGEGEAETEQNDRRSAND
jgi:hypothetical protein